MPKKWGRAEFAELKKLQERLLQLENGNFEKFCNAAAKELAARLLALVIPATPVGEYPNETGKKGGTLRRGWLGNAGGDVDVTEKDAAKAAGRSFGRSLPIEKSGNTYTITVENTVSYASYVEFGHRQTPGRYVPAIDKKLKERFVYGKYFLTRSEEELERIAPAILQRKLDKFLKEVFRGGGTDV